MTETVSAAAPQPVPAGQGDPGPRVRHPAVAAAPALVALVLLFVAAWADGGFALRSWGPLAVFALAALAFGRRNDVGGAALAAVGALFAYAMWTLLSVSWADAPGRAVEGAGRTLLYAALFAVPVLTLPTRRSAAFAAGLVTAGAGIVVAATAVACAVHGADWFLAGRLDDPVGYRNGTAALFALAFWPLLAAAARRATHPLLRAGCFSLAVTALALAFLTQSRGVLIGFTCGAVVALALGPDRLRRAWLTLAAVAAIAIASEPLLAPYDAFVAAGTGTDPEAVDEAVAALLVVAGAGFAGMLLVALFDGGLRMSERHMRQARSLAAGALAVVALGAVVVGIAVVGDPIAFGDDKAREFRQLDAAAPGESRLGSTGGQRYDLWRIALDEFRSAPLVGVGEASYPAGYYRDRETDRNLSTPHSLPLGVLAETGLVGALLLLGALAAAAVAIGSGWRRAGPEERRWASALAAAGAVVIGQAAVDWLWLIPGLMGLALVCVAIAVAIVSLPRAGDPAPRPRHRAWTAARAVPAAAALLVAVLFLSDFHTRTARADVSTAERLSAATAAERLNPFALPPRYLQAGAYEELGRRDDARRELLGALDREPSSFVTMGLLGDLETRAGNRAAARDWYRRALALNPRDVGLQQLAR